MKDIYFDEKFLKVYETHENGILGCFKYSDASGEMQVYFIKRSLSDFSGGEGYYDITTPYGYGGPRIIHCSPGSEKTLTENFFSAFENYCKEEKIISFFCRFHPIIKNAAYSEKGFDEIKLNRQIVVTDLSRDFEEEFAPRAFKDSKYSRRKGVSIEFDTADRYLDHFIELYYESMKQKHADGYYFFQKSYFEYLFNQFPGEIILATAIYRKMPINHKMMFIYGDIAYGHLICKVSEFSNFRPNDLSYFDSMVYAKEKGCRFFVSGGGLSNDPEDSLLKYKMKFSTSPLQDFYIGKKVYDKEVYDQLCRNISEITNDFFPLYRISEHEKK